MGSNDVSFPRLVVLAQPRRSGWIVVPDRCKGGEEASRLATELDACSSHVFVDGENDVQVARAKERRALEADTGICMVNSPLSTQGSGLLCIQYANVREKSVCACLSLCLRQRGTPSSC